MEKGRKSLNFSLKSRIAA